MNPGMNPSTNPHAFGVCQSGCQNIPSTTQNQAAKHRRYVSHEGVAAYPRVPTHSPQ